MTDIASLTGNRHVSSSLSSSSSTSSYIASPQHSLSSVERLSSVSQHRPPRLDLSASSSNATLPRRPQSQPIMATSSRNEKGSHVAMMAATPLLPPTPVSSSYTHHDDKHGGPKSKKRSISIDVEEANISNTARLSLYTPATARSDGPLEICLCTKAPKVPRPRNAFILYRQAWQGSFAAQYPGLANPEISKRIGEKWREEPESVKAHWKDLADEEKARHQLQYPGYRYQPRRGGKSGNGRSTASNGDTPGRCPNCGGRYIATPGAPGAPEIPFSVASPPPSKRPPNMQPYMNADHSRHGSISGSVTPIDGHSRRFTQSYPREMEEDYPIMSPSVAPLSGIPPDAKRRRYNGPPVYVPGSPRTGGYASIDTRYQQRPSTGMTPISATGYGPGHFPRPHVQHRQGYYSAYPNNPHMQPPPQPRQSMSYQSISATPNRPNAGFDESLRLPPLQTQTQESPTMSAEPSARQVMPPVQHQHTPGTGLGIVNPGSGPARQQPQPLPPASPMVQKWPFMLKLEILRSIGPPLRLPGPGEIRGPIIAVEGAPTPILKDVASVIEKALSVSTEFAVQVWSEDTAAAAAVTRSSPEPHVGGGYEANGNADVHENETHNNSGKGGRENVSGGNGDAGTVQRKPPSLVSPVASYVARILKWHKTSSDLIRYITSSPPQREAGVDAGIAGSNKDVASSSLSRPRLPIAIISDGYSFTISERYAAALKVDDAYRADDHWQWVATLWRGIVGADLTVYVKKAADESKGVNGSGSNNSVEIAGPGIMVLHVPDGGEMDEKLERRLGFEIAEWVRSGGFRAG